MDSDGNAEMQIFARWKGDSPPEFYVGSRGMMIIEDFHDDACWNIDMGECRPCYTFDQLERDVAMLGLIYTEYTFGFYTLTFKKRETYDDDMQSDFDPNQTAMDDALCSDPM